MAVYARRAWLAFLVLYLAATGATALVSPFLFAGVGSNPAFWILLVLLVGAVVAVPVASRAGRGGWAFIASSLTIVAMIFLSGVSLYPRLVPARPNLDLSLTIHNAASSPLTLEVMLIIALVGMPLVLAYTVVIYRVFRGKTSPGAAYSPEVAAGGTAPERPGTRAV